MSGGLCQQRLAAGCGLQRSLLPLPLALPLALPLPLLPACPNGNGPAVGGTRRRVPACLAAPPRRGAAGAAAAAGGEARWAGPWQQAGAGEALLRVSRSSRA